jgi:hypothetical protein
MSVLVSEGERLSELLSTLLATIQLLERCLESIGEVGLGDCFVEWHCIVGTLCPSGNESQLCRHCVY